MMKKDKQSGQRHKPEWVFRPERAAAAARREMQDFIERHQRAGDRPEGLGAINAQGFDKE